MGKVVGIQNLKGGVGKTTIAYILGNQLAREGFKTLLIDGDPQASLTRLMGHVPRFYSTPHDITCIFDVDSEASPVPLKESENLYLLPSSSGYASKVDPEVLRNGVFLLREFVSSIKDNYDFVVIDTPAGISDITRATYVASEHTLLVQRPNYLDETGLVETLKLMARLKKFYPSAYSPKLLGFVITDFDRRYRSHAETIEWFRKEAFSFIAEKFPGIGIEGEEAVVGELPRRSVYERAMREGEYVVDYAKRTGQGTDVVEHVESFIENFLGALAVRG